MSQKPPRLVDIVTLGWGKKNRTQQRVKGTIDVNDDSDMRKDVD